MITLKYTTSSHIAYEYFAFIIYGDVAQSEEFTALPHPSLTKKKGGSEKYPLITYA